MSFSLCIISCSEEEAIIVEPVEFILIPGQGINNLKIGDLGSQVEIELGVGFDEIKNVGISGNATYNYFNDTEGIDIVFGLQNSADLDIDTLSIEGFIFYENFGGSTSEGIGIGSSKAEVVASYGEPDQIDFDVNVYDIGMLISYDEMDNVSNISILEI